MKKISLGLVSIVLTALLVGCTSESTSTTEFNVTTTTDEGTKEYSYKSENNNGDVSTSSTVTETANDDEDDTVSYEVKNGTLIIEAPSKDTDWWEVIPYEKYTTLRDWSVTDGVYTGVVEALFSQGTGYVVVGEYNDPDSNPISFAIIQVDIEDSEIVSVGEAVMVDSMDEYFPVFEKGYIASDENGNDLTLFAFYSDYDDIYLRLYDGENEAYKMSVKQRREEGKKPRKEKAWRGMTACWMKVRRYIRADRPMHIGMRLISIPR